MRFDRERNKVIFDYKFILPPIRKVSDEYSQLINSSYLKTWKCAEKCLNLVTYSSPYGNVDIRADWSPIIHGLKRNSSDFKLDPKLEEYLKNNPYPQKNNKGSNDDADAQSEGGELTLF